MSSWTERAHNATTVAPEKKNPDGIQKMNFQLQFDLNSLPYSYLLFYYI